MKTMMMTPMRMCCCCCSSMQMMRNDKEKSDQHIINIYKEPQEYEEEHFYDSFDFRAAA